LKKLFLIFPMSSFVCNIELRNQKKNGLPEFVILTSSTGEKGLYYQKDEPHKGVCIINLAAGFELPVYEVEGKCDEDDMEACYAKCTETIKTMPKKFKLALEKADHLRSQCKIEIDKQHTMLEKVIRESYLNKQRNWCDRMEELEDPARRLNKVLSWMKKYKDSGFVKAVQLLESEREYLINKVKLPEFKFDNFMSHVQKLSGDLCGRLKDALALKGMSTWYDKDASRVDKRGMIDGVVDSKLFVVVLTLEYFKRPWCIFEYAVAIVARKTVMTVYENDTRYGGDHLNCYKIPKEFRSLLNHELIKIDRNYWEGFFRKFEGRMRSTLKKANRTQSFLSSSNILTKVFQVDFLLRELLVGGWTIGKRLFSSVDDGCTVKSLLFSSVDDGFTMKSFNAKCINMGATLTVVKRDNGRIFGAFVPISWKSRKEGRWVEADGTWLFDLKDVPEVTHAEKGDKCVFQGKTTAPYIQIAQRTGFGILCGFKIFRNHLLFGEFAGNTGTSRLEIAEYEVFQVEASRV